MVRVTRSSKKKSATAVEADLEAADSEQSEEEEESEHSEAENKSADDSESEEEDGEDVTAIFKGASVPEGSEEESSDEQLGEEEETDVAPSKTSDKVNEQCTFDLRNLLAVNSYQIATSSLYKTNGASQSDENIHIPLDKDHCLAIDEDFLLAEAGEGCTQLVRALWQLPTEKSDAGPLITLPGYDAIPIPRALAPPPPKEDTKWEKFAKAKGIPLNKEKRSRKVWDETTGTWMFRHGFEKANSRSKEWPIMEVGTTDDPFEDPWEKIRDAKRTRTEKNLESRMKNQERAGNLAKGTTNRLIKSRESSHKAGKEGGNMDRDNPLPIGVPVDLKSSSSDAKQRGKVSTVAALEAVQRSTASLGRFDKIREGEPERKKTLSKMKKRKFDPATDKRPHASEGEKSMKILNSVMNGGGVSKEKAIRKGKFAKGETAYDYDYDDGLGPSSFKKKKGRAGAGKMKKMTKKRVK